MALVALSTKAVGSTVKLKVNGTTEEFIIVHQGNPSDIYDDSCNGTWLLMKNIFENRQWHSVYDNSYKDSSIHSYLNSTFLNLLESNIKAQVKKVKIPYSNGNSDEVYSGGNGLSTQIFLLSGYEVGFTISDKIGFPMDGAKLTYFESGTGTSANNKRTATLNGSPTVWWLRSPNTKNGYDVWSVYSEGKYNYWHATNSFGIRPAFILPSTLLVSDNGSVVTNTAPKIISTSGASGVNLGTKKAAFSFKYTPTDADGDKLTVTEKLDGVIKKTRTNVASGTQLTFECASTAAEFQKISNGSHTITIQASDGKATATFTAKFTKTVTKATITLKQPLAVEGDITLAIMTVAGSIPADAKYKVETTNNAKDSAPVWQDVTTEVMTNQNIVFENTSNTKGAAFNFRITVERGSSGVGGYITSVIGAFQ